MYTTCEFDYSAKGNDDIKCIELTNNPFYDFKHSTLLWISNDNDTNTADIQDDNNDDVRLEQTMTSTEFKIAVMNGLFDLLFNVLDVINEIVFVDNVLANYNNNDASEHNYGIRRSIVKLDYYKTQTIKIV